MARFLSPLLVAALLCSNAQAKGHFLPPVARTATARKARRANPAIRATRDRHFKGARPSPRKLAAEKKLAERAERFAKKLAASGDSRPIIIVLEGVDGAGKSSFIRRLRPALTGRTVEVIHFGAPEPGERNQPWQQRYFDKLKPEPNKIYILDRSYHGEAVYPLYHKLVNQAQHRERVAGIPGIERTLRRDFRMVKFFFDASPERQGATGGKRESIESKRNLLHSLTSLLGSPTAKADAPAVERVVLGRLEELRSNKKERQLKRGRQARLLGDRLAQDFARLPTAAALGSKQAQLATHRSLMAEDFRVVEKLVKQLAKSKGVASTPTEFVEPEKLAASDYTTLLDRKQIGKLFTVSVAQTAPVTPWHFIKMDKRMKGTASAFDVLEKELLATP